MVFTTRLVIVTVRASTKTTAEEAITENVTGNGLKEFVSHLTSTHTVYYLTNKTRIN